MSSSHTDTQARDELFAVLRAALGTAPSAAPPVVTHWPAVIALAVDQGVAGLVYGVVSRLPAHCKPPLETAIEGMARLLTIEQLNNTQDAAIARLVAMIEEAGLHPLLMKGQAIGRLYPEPGRRMPGDIDLCFAGDECAHAVAWAERFDNDIERQWRQQRHRHDFTCIIDDQVVELHPQPETFAHRTLNRRLRSITAHELATDQPCTVTVGGRPVATLPPTLGALHQLIHITRHLLEAGVGLKQLCDLAVYLTYHVKDIDGPRLRAYIDELELTTAAAAIGHILRHKLGVAAAALPFAIDGRHAPFIVDEVFAGGNFGEHNISGRHAMPTARRKVWSAVYFVRRGLKYRRLVGKEARSVVVSKIILNFVRIMPVQLSAEDTK